MIPFLRPATKIPRELAGPPSQSQAGRIWRAILGTILVTVTATLVTDVAIRPTKRGVEVLAAFAFLGLAIVASPVRVLSFAITLLPYPMQTSAASTSTLMILAIGSLIMAKRRQFQLPSPFFCRPVDLSIMGLSLMSLLSLNQLASEHYGEALFNLVALGAAICLYYSVVQVVRDLRSFHTILRVFMVTATSVGLIATLQTLFPPHTFLPSFFQYSARLKEYEGSLTEAARVYASFAGISPFGEFVSTSLVLHYILFRRSTSLAERLYWIGSAALLTIGMLGSATRMALISVGVGALYMLVMGGRVIPRAQLLRVFFVLFALVVLALPFMGSVTDLMTERLETLGPKDGSAQSRWGAMEQALDAIPDSPFIGHGLIIPIDTFRGGVTRIVHCLYIHIPYTIGIPGLIAFLWLVVSQWRLSLRVMNDRSLPTDLREFTLATHTTLVMFLLYQLTSDYIVDPMSTHLAWLRFGLLMALVRIAGRMKLGAVSTVR